MFIALFIFNLIFTILNFKLKNHKSSLFSAFACGLLLVAILKDYLL